jgi:hypothetical protein
LFRHVEDLGDPGRGQLRARLAARRDPALICTTSRPRLPSDEKVSWRSWLSEPMKVR